MVAGGQPPEAARDDAEYVDVELVEHVLGTAVAGVTAAAGETRRRRWLGAPTPSVTPESSTVPTRLRATTSGSAPSRVRHGLVGAGDLSVIGRAVGNT